MKTRSNMPLFVVECNDVKALSNSQIDLLRCGDYLVKKDESGEHAYKVTFKKEGVGMCLTYTDASVVETQSYDYVDGNWVYNSEDKTDLLAKTTESDIDSGDATNGQVLTADGDGGASWEDIPQPELKLYAHYLYFAKDNFAGRTIIYSTNSTPFTYDTLKAKLGSAVLPVGGVAGNRYVAEYITLTTTAGTGGYIDLTDNSWHTDSGIPLSSDTVIEM